MGEEHSFARERPPSPVCPKCGQPLGADGTCAGCRREKRRDAVRLLRARRARQASATKAEEVATVEESAEASRLAEESPSTSPSLRGATSRGRKPYSRRTSRTSRQDKRGRAAPESGDQSGDH